MRSKGFRAALAILVSCGLLALVLRRLDGPAAWARLQAADPLWLICSALLSGLVLILRGKRFATLMARPDVPVATAAVGIQVFLTRVTPFRLGELALPYLLRRHLAEDPAHSLVSLLFVRLIDLCLISGAAALGALLYAGAGGRWQLSAVALLVILGSLVFTFRTWLRLALSLATRFSGATGLSRFPFVARVLARLGGVLAESASLTRTQQAAVGGWSIAVFLVQTALLGVLPLAFGVRLEPLQVVIGASIAQLGAAVPVASVGSIGTLEASWIAGFVWVGVSENDAIVTAIAAQVLTLAFAALFAGPCWLYLGRRGVDP